MTRSDARRMPFRRYTAFPPVELADRTWPTRTIDRAPQWCSVDLRDGNQALIDPMDADRKMRMFRLLVDMGYKEIEVGFPAASATDFDFIRALVEQDLVPDDVTIQVLTQAREELIERTVQSLVGLRGTALIHLYNSTSTLQRRVVFGLDRDGIKDIAVRGAQWCQKYAEELLGHSGGRAPRRRRPSAGSTAPSPSPAPSSTTRSRSARPSWTSGSRPPSNPVVLNLPATVEMSVPSTYADQIEWFGRALGERRSSVILSLHPHNDRGTAVAAAELGVMAGADRVEGCLFGNGERTGNVCLVTLGLNLFSQGVDPADRLQRRRRGAPHRRALQPAAGAPAPPVRRRPRLHRLLRLAPGRHQEGLRGARARRRRAGVPVREHTWGVPYLPIDPLDVGRSYEAVIRVNSQSGKGGVAYVLKNEHHLDLPRRMQIEFSRVVQEVADDAGGEIAPPRIWELFTATYLQHDAPLRLVSFTSATGDSDRLEAVVSGAASAARSAARATARSRRSCTRCRTSTSTRGCSTTPSTPPAPARRRRRRPTSRSPSAGASCGAAASTRASSRRRCGRS